MKEINSQDVLCIEEKDTENSGCGAYKNGMCDISDNVCDTCSNVRIAV